MPQIHLYDVGDTVRLDGPPHFIAVIKSKTSSSVTVDCQNLTTGKREVTQWSPQTVVRLFFYKEIEQPPKQAQESPSQASKVETHTKPPSPPLKPLQKPTAKKEKAVPAEPKPKAEKDAFNVKVGSMASKVNSYLLKIRKGITVDAILANVEGSKKDNVVSHLRRMIRDGLITNKGNEKNLIVSVRKDIK